jgi:hypothetical protein
MATQPIWYDEFRFGNGWRINIKSQARDDSKNHMVGAPDRITVEQNHKKEQNRQS